MIAQLIVILILCVFVCVRVSLPMGAMQGSKLFFWVPCTIVGILTFISMINTTCDRLKARYFFIYRYEQMNFMLS